MGPMKGRQNDVKCRCLLFLSIFQHVSWPWTVRMFFFLQILIGQVGSFSSNMLKHMERDWKEKCNAKRVQMNMQQIMFSSTKSNNIRCSFSWCNTKKLSLCIYISYIHVKKIKEKQKLARLLYKIPSRHPFSASPVQVTIFSSNSTRKPTTLPAWIHE